IQSTFCKRDSFTLQGPTFLAAHLGSAAPLADDMADTWEATVP
ncbi:jg27881, partial [Pararge aegeria aegeria]